MEGHLVPEFSRYKSNLHLKITLTLSFLHSLPHDFAQVSAVVWSGYVQRVALLP